MVNHGKNFLQFKQLFSSDGTCSQQVMETSNIVYYVHGAFMWISWALIGLLQISTIRYYSTHWKWNKIVHLILGVFSTVLMITAGLLAL